MNDMLLSTGLLTGKLLISALELIERISWSVYRRYTSINRDINK